MANALNETVRKQLEWMNTQEFSGLTHQEMVVLEDFCRNVERLISEDT